MNFWQDSASALVLQPNLAPTRMSVPRATDLPLLRGRLVFGLQVLERTPANAPRNGNAEPAQTASDSD